MNTITSILDSIPLLRHCTDGELTSLASLCRISSVKRAQVIDLKKINALNIIQSGVFELEFSGKRDHIFLTPGSFFGDFPFTDIRNRGTVRAVSEGSIIHLNSDDLYKFFFMNYKSLRGYVRSLEALGMEVSPVGKSHFTNKSSIVTVFSHVDGSGKSLLSSALALSLADKDKTVLLDMSYAGTSVYNYLNRKITPALSQKQEQSSTPEELISQRIEKISDNLSLLNVLHGAKVKANTSIISPLLLVLSKIFKYIVIDLSNSDMEIRDGVFNVSDTVIGILKKIKERSTISDIFDERLTQGQRVIYLLNRYFRDNSPFEGGYMWDTIDASIVEDAYDSYEALKSSIPDVIPTIITSPKNALVLPSGPRDGFTAGGVFLELIRSRPAFDMFYTTFMGFSSLAAYLFAENDEDYKKLLLKIFSAEMIKSQMDITFPREYIFKNSKIQKAANDMTHGARIEFFKVSPMLAVSGMDETRRIFSTGQLADLLTVSRIVYPFFEECRITGIPYESGFPRSICRPEDMYRMNTTTTVLVSTSFKNDSWGSDGLLPFYKKFLDRFHPTQALPFTPSLHEKELIIDITEENDEPEKILEHAGRATNKFLKENNFI